MIADTDTLSLAPGVSVRRGHVADAVRGSAWPLNPSGELVLAHAGLPVAQIVRVLADAFSLPTEAARHDVLRFVWHVNALALVNVERSGSRLRQLIDWFVLAARLAPAGAVPGAVSRRRGLDTRTMTRGAVSSFAAIASRLAFVAAAATAVAAQLSAVAGPPGYVVPIALGLGTGVGLGLHEAAHAASLRGVPSALVLRGRRTYVLHAPVGATRRSVVAVAGPLTVAVVGLALIQGGAAAGAPELTILGLPLAVHALSLSVAGGDGRIACGL